MENVFVKIGHGLEWVGEEAEKVVVDVPKALNKILVLSDDAKTIASDAGNQVVTVMTDVSGLVVAVQKDDGASLQAIGQLVSTGEAAIAADGLNAADDVAVLAAAKAFFASLAGTNYKDVLTAIAKLISDGKIATATVVQDFKKLEADATA